MNANEILKKIGFTNAEIKVYLALVELGSSSINNIQEKTNIERRYIYDVLNKLIEKGFVSYTTEKGKKTYQITNPNRILGFVQEQKSNLEETEKDINQVLPQIIQQFNEHKPDIKVEILRGKEGMKALGEDLLTVKNNYFIGGNGSVQEYMPYFWIHYNKKRIKKKVFWHDLIIEGTLMDDFKSLAKAREELKKLKFYEYKIIPSKLGSPHIISIFGDKVAMTLWKDQPFTVVIQNKDIADSYLEYFKFLWNVAKE